jgi:hypothetical protein
MARVQHQSETFSVAILSKRFRNVRWIDKIILHTSFTVHSAL